MHKILSELVITKIYSISTMYTQKNDNKITRKKRPCWGLILKYEGETVYSNHTSNYISDEKHLMILPKNSSYEWVCTKSGHYVIVDFECNLEINELFCLDIGENTSIVRILKDLEQLQLSKKSFSNIESLHLLYSLLVKAFKAHQDSAQYVPIDKKERLLPAFHYIINNFTKPIKNDDLAALCKISTVYFRELFYKVYGVSPMNYIQNLRIRRAKEMLRSDYSSITDIAFALGYNNIYEFSKAFKKHTGVPPTKY